MIQLSMAVTFKVMQIVMKKKKQIKKTSIFRSELWLIVSSELLFEILLTWQDGSII